MARFLRVSPFMLPPNPLLNTDKFKGGYAHKAHHAIRLTKGIVP
ncbi:MAG: hypothetical protein ACRCTD_09125 [Beijerinckiaceae bacterium]